MSTLPTAASVVLRIQGEEQDMVFATGAELDNVRDLNADGDLLDTVLYLLDGTGSAAGTSYALPALSTELAVRQLDQSVRRASRRGAHDWLVAFLVSELGQGAQSLDRGGAQPSTCAADFYLADDVLAFLYFSAFSTSPGALNIVSTGVPGRRRIEIAEPYLATLVREADWGPGT